MPGIHLFTSNKLEVLVDRLAAEIKTRPLPVFEQEVIVVQSKGMQHWLSLEIAERNQIIANTVFPFPKAFVYSLFENLAELPEGDPYSPDTMTWRIMNTLPHLLDEPGFISLKRYCEGTAGELKLFQLSERIAAIFDKYLVYRPDLINEWDRNRNPLAEKVDDSKWQFSLWRHFTEDDRDSDSLVHMAELRLRFLASQKELNRLPSRVSVFGISSLPPYYLDIFQKLSEHSEVFIYYLNPCQHFWEYSYSEREIATFLKAGIEEEHQYYEEGNPLLASMGVSGREFFSLILNVLEDTGEPQFVEPEPHHLLQMLQADILNLENRNIDHRIEIKKEDRSVQIHSCHSPTREIEVLHDNLLSLFAEDTELKPKDIVVMMPDVSIYAPLIRAVFDGQEADAAVIPYSISDVTLEDTSVIAETFLAILALNSNRFKATDVLDILENQAIRDRFRFSEKDIDQIRTWVIQSGIRWGVDGEYKHKLGLPAFQEHTWQFGLKRLLLGVALPENEESELFAGISPYPGMEGGETSLLGRFADFIETLVNTSEKLGEAKNLEGWSTVLNDILSNLFAENEHTENELQATRDILSEGGLLGLYHTSAYREKVSLDVISAYLKKRLARDLRSSGFISRGVTFCTLLPMRSIPFKVIYILGMNDGDFPRSFPQSRFDLCEKDKRLCDRSRRDEDKYLFLESLLSARDHLIISYLGQDIIDNTEKPPSVLVSELCDVLKAGFIGQDNQDLLDQVIIKHPLQPFNAYYFDQSKELFSYSRLNLQAATSNNDSLKKERRFFSGPLTEPDDSDWRSLSLDQFFRFFHNPSDFLLQNRLNIRAGMVESLQVIDREPFDLDKLQQYKLKESLIDDFPRVSREEGFFELIKAKGEVAHGIPGKIMFSDLKNETKTLLAVIAGFGEFVSPGPQVQYRNKENLIVLGGILKNISLRGQVFVRPAKIKARDIIKVWIHHLMGALYRDTNTPISSFCIGIDKAIEFAVLEKKDAEQILGSLVGLFVSGLKAPLEFFPQASLAYAQSYLIKQAGNEGAARSAAEKQWYPGFKSDGEQANEAFRLCFGESPVLGNAFRNTALTVFEPVFKHSKEKKLNELL